MESELTAGARIIFCLAIILGLVGFVAGVTWVFQGITERWKREVDEEGEHVTMTPFGKEDKDDD